MVLVQSSARREWTERDVVVHVANNRGAFAGLEPENRRLRSQVEPRDAKPLARQAFDHCQASLRNFRLAEIDCDDG